ncbi:MAG: winged helix-turn-helix transcriptional regulator [Bacteroidales bacterium]
MLHYREKSYVCLLDVAMDCVRGKWKGVILCHLYDGPKRFLELQRVTGGVSHKVLTEKLSELEGDGILVKHIFHEAVPKVEYELTPKGKELAHAIKEIERWAIKHYQDEVETY